VEFDSSIDQDAIDASGLGAAQGSFGPSGFSSDLGDGSSGEDFNSFAFDRTPQQTYTMGRGATATNPFPESIFSRIFGAENVSYVDPQTGRGMGGMDLAGINQLRFDQAMNPSQFKMGDFYVGQPTFEEGIVREVPRGGIMSMIPGISTVANLFGRNRGLPEGSDAFRKAVEESKKPVFQPLTDIINSITSGIGSFVDRFRPEESGDRDTVTDRPIEPRGTELGDMTTTNAFIPDARVVVDNFNRPMLNTGIANVAPTMANQANMAVTDALQLIPQGTLGDSIGVRNQVAQALNPELKAFINRQPPIDQRLRELQKEREQIQREEQFKADVLKSIQNRDLQNRNSGLLSQDFINRSLNKEPFKDEGTFINLDNI
tara:strand:+ start:188 stop:1309 length:1122 start_codon:yes stop_codon:yes gene_type:complete